MCDARLQRKVSLADIMVCLQIIDTRRVNDLALIDDSGVAGQSKAEVHVLLSDEDGGSGTTQLPQQFADTLHDDGREALTRLVKQQQRGIAHESTRDGQHLLFAA